jgi:dUTP pyrophosphatase
MTNIIRITLMPDASTPTRGSARASGYDLYAPEDVELHPGIRTTISTGVSLELPDGWEAQVRGRSSLNKNGVWVPLGTCDADYRGPIGVTLLNLSGHHFQIVRGDRIAQLVFARVEHVAMEVVTELSTTVRGASGFGSTGK